MERVAGKESLAEPGGGDDGVKPSPSPKNPSTSWLQKLNL